MFELLTHLLTNVFSSFFKTKVHFPQNFLQKRVLYFQEGSASPKWSTNFIKDTNRPGSSLEIYHEPFSFSSDDEGQCEDNSRYHISSRY